MKWRAETPKEMNGDKIPALSLDIKNEWSLRNMSKEQKLHE